MSANTRIEWATHTFNPWIGCHKVSEACKHCYAERDRATQMLGVNWGPTTNRYVKAESGWKEPLSWNRKAEKAGEQHRVFCASLADVFEDRRELDGQRERLWKLINETPNLDWLLLTKRIEHVGAMVPWGATWPSNVWLGCTAENQRRVDERLPYLLAYPAAVRFISSEPLLEAIDVGKYIHGLDWIITGGESGSRARATPPDWFRRLRDQAVSGGTAFFFKQWGKHAPGPDGGMVQLGRAKAEPILDGRRWNELPSPRPARRADKPFDRFDRILSAEEVA